jgi:type VI secretion system protein ImpH
MYKAWEKNSLNALYEIPSKDFYSRILGSLAGIGLPSLKGRELPDETLYYYSSLFSHKIHSAKTLQGILSEYFNLTITIQELEPKWLYLPHEECTAITKNKISFYNQLGKNIILGRRYLSVQSHFRIIINTMNYAQYNLLMPNGELIKSIIEMTRLFVRYELSFDIKITLNSQEVPFCSLSSHPTCRLAWNSWLLSKPSSTNLSSVINIH